MKIIFYVYLPLAVLILAFWLFYSHYEPYQTSSLELIGRSDGGQDSKATHEKPGEEGLLAGTPYEKWQYSENVEWDNRGGYSGAGGIRLPGGVKGGSYLAYKINNPGEWEYLRFSGYLRAQRVVKGDRPWNRVRLLLVFRDAENKAYWEHPHSLVSLDGSHNWKKYTRVFPVPDYAATAHVVAQNTGRSGAAWLDELSVVAVTRKSSFLWINLAAGLIWFAVLILVIQATGIWRLRYQWVVIGLIVLIVSGVALPQPWLNSLAEKTKALIIAGAKETEQKHWPDLAVSPRDNKVGELLADYSFESQLGQLKSAGHVALFALICFFLNLSYGERNKASTKRRKVNIWPVISIGAGLALFAGATEALQFIPETRSASIQDWFFDLSGIIAGTIMYGVYARFKG